MIIDEKFILAPPPPYIDELGSNNPYRRRSSISFSMLPSHLLLHVVYSTFPLPYGPPDSELFTLQRENLYWLETSLRLVNRELYIACMHVLRSAYLPTYNRLVRPPYTSDPFPSSTCVESSSSVILKHHRELITLDRFIALLAHEERLLDSSELHLPCEEAYRDMFDRRQPQSRLEDLVCIQGKKYGVIYVDLQSPRPNHHSMGSAGDSSAIALGDAATYSPKTSTLTLLSNSSSSSFKKAQQPEKQSRPSQAYTMPPKPTVPQKKRYSFTFGRAKKTMPSYAPQYTPEPAVIEPIPFSTISVAFSSRKVGLVYTPPPAPTAKASTTTSTLSPRSSTSFSVYGGSTYGALSMSMNASLQRSKTLIEVSRSKDESLESLATRLIQKLSAWMEE